MFNVHPSQTIVIARVFVKNGFVIHAQVPITNCCLQHQNIIIFPLTPKAWKEVEVEETTTLLLFTWNGISKLTVGSGRILQWCTLVNREMVKRTM
jgi:hypothetical protein